MQIKVNQQLAMFQFIAHTKNFRSHHQLTMPLKELVKLDRAISDPARYTHFSTRDGSRIEVYKLPNSVFKVVLKGGEPSENITTITRVSMNNTQATAFKKLVRQVINYHKLGEEN